MATSHRFHVHAAHRAASKLGWTPRPRTCHSNARLVAAPQSRSLLRSSPFVSGISLVNNRSSTRLQAVAAPPRTAVVVKDLPLRNGAQINVVVQRLDNGGQLVRITTGLQAGRLLLHWGVEGGKDYQGGWRLPSCRPEGTVQYKNRALQSPFKSMDGQQELLIELSPEEASDVLNFVLKDDATNSWYDNNGQNFAVPLREELASASGNKVDVLPKELCDKWAWVRWDSQGRPSRSQEGAAEEYQTGVLEMQMLLAQGKNLNDLWAVVEGKQDYQEMVKQVHGGGNGQQQQQQQQQQRELGPVPDDLVGVQAYVLWESRGKPNNADFSCEARRVLEDRARAGTAYEDIAAELNYFPDWVKAKRQQQQQPPVEPPPEDLVGVQAYLLWESRGKPNNADFGPEARSMLEQERRSGATYAQIAGKLNYCPDWAKSGEQQQQQKQQPPPQPAAPQQQQQQKQQPAGVGTPLSNVAKRNPLDMVKRATPPALSNEKNEKQEQPLDFLVQRFAVDPNTKWRRTFSLGGKSEMLAVVRQKSPDLPARVDLISDLASELVLHWGVCKPGSREWLLAPEDVWPEDTKAVAAASLESPFLPCDDDECDLEVSGAVVPLQRATILVPPGAEVGALTFVLRSKDNTMWYKDGNSNFTIPVPSKGAPAQDDPLSKLGDELSRAIVEAEASSAWTLMHRFNKAADLLSEVLNGYYDDLDMAAAMARIYVWLRYSSTRQLTWQRNYNTQPRILSAAQDRLTNAISQAHSKTTGEAQEWVRMMLTTVGRGGDGQKIRDEILNIMHRNHIPETKGHFVEEWHQKLHNNTTPDDVPICEAYIAFLQSNGDINAYWRVLSDAGIMRERLEGFDRPIKSEPQFWPEKKDALIGEFRNYLGILKAVHSGADLQASATAAGNRIPDQGKGYLAYVMSHLRDSSTLPLMEAAVEARTELAASVTGQRELLYLDLALEDQVRQAAERSVGSAGFGAAAFMKPLLQNLALSLGDNEEICYCLKTWLELPKSVTSGGRPSKEEALQAVAVINRIRRAISEISDRVVTQIGDVSKVMGEAFGVPQWAHELFAEEVVRGGPAFAVSLVISSIEPVLRNAAALGAWQVISPTEVTGVVEVVPGLSEVQDKTYDTPTVLIAEQVTGEEEIPEGVVAVLTPDAPDVLSHVSVRARNMRVLFATCHDAEPLNELKAAAGKTLHFQTTASGAVTWGEPQAKDMDKAGSSGAQHKGVKGLKISVPKWCGKWVVPMSEYKDGVVGAKSKNLAGLQGKLPDWINLPNSVTVPFGCFEQVLELPENKEIMSEIQGLVSKLQARKASVHTMSMDEVVETSDQQAGDSAAGTLARCRELAMQVVIPEQLKADLAKAMETAGLTVPTSEERWSQALTALKGVWASKYNDRAYYSLRKVGLNFDDVRMAVLVQRVVPAQYAFVIHTKNPSNNDENEIFAELVRGLGESLVSGMIAGSAVAFKASKDNLDQPEVLCYASKSEAMFVPESLIFRSDSNGEDLEGYAGAGLYESITMDATETRRIDYMDDKLVQDPAFRKDLLARICKVGAAIEQALGSAQDVEGVVGPDNSITVVQTRPQV